MYEIESNPNRMIQSIIIYINRYVDTSFKKEDRLEAASIASEISQTICFMYPLETDTDRLIYNSFLKLSTKLSKACLDRNNLYDFENELGFLNIINNNVSE